MSRRGVVLVLAQVALALAIPASAEPGAEVARVRAEDAMPRGPGLDERLAIIRRRIQEALVYPPLARWRDQSGEAVVRFEIDAEGQAHNVSLARSSGRHLLDEAAVRAVEDAGRLPRVYVPLEVPVRFAFEDERGR